MRTAILAVVCFIAPLAALSSLAPGQDFGTEPHVYYLHQPSSYQEGCWGACACPLSNEEPMRGSFTLALANIGNATDFYSISNVHWAVPTLAGQPFNVALDGSGSFLAGQSPFATHQYMPLDLTLTPIPFPWTGPQHFDTTNISNMRTVAPPVIVMQVANSTGCPGIRLRIAASWYRSDIDNSGTIAVTDIFAFLDSWFAGSAYADFNASSALEVQDIFDFLGAWFAGV